MTHTGIAKRVYDDIMGLDPVGAQMYAQIAVAECLQYDMEYHQDLIQNRIDAIVSKRVSKVQGALKKSYVSKALKGEDTDHLEAANVFLSKAGGFSGMSDAERREYIRVQGRDPLGRFKSKPKTITYHDNLKPFKGRQARAIGIPDPGRKVKDAEGNVVSSPIKLSERDQAQYQQAYMQVRDLLNEFRDLPAKYGTVHMTYQTGPAGKLVTETSNFSPGSAPDLDATKFKGAKEKRLVQAEVEVDSGLNVEGAVFNTVGALGGPTAGGLAMKLATQNDAGAYTPAEKLGSFGDEWNQALRDNPTNPANRIFLRMRTGSKFLEDAGLGRLGPQAQMAMRAADMVGQYGPEAQKVIGPRATRSTYRYRGVERKPEPILQAAVTAYHNNAIERGQSQDAARLAMRSGRWETPKGRPGENLGGRLVNGVWTPSPAGQGPGAVFVPSPLIGYLENRLASEDLTNLQRQSGVIPPSEGIIIDKKGKVVTQAVGYGDDWYLPFNLRTLSKLKGGDYIRTRAWGGPTTEDVYTGLMAGARSITVISHNGTYTMEFDDSMRGTRRYSDKAARMVKRYGHLLDAVKSEQVTVAGVPEERLEELKEEAAREHNPARREERFAYNKLLRDLTEEEKLDPQMPKAQQAKLAEDFLNEIAQTRHTTRDGYAADWTAMAHKHVNDEVGRERLAYQQRFGGVDAATGVSGFDETVARQMAAGKVSTPMSAIQELGYQKQWEERLKHAQNEYISSQSPLHLDGNGYAKAQLALWEQFPYYLKKPTYLPKKTGHTDYGYVKPRFNRPAGAKVGYYDESITGTGKVDADVYGMQNVALGATKISELKSKQSAARKAEREGPKDVTTAAAGTGKTPDLEDTYEAIMALRKHVLANDVKGPDGKMVSVGQARDSLNREMPILFRMPDSELYAELKRDKAKVIKDLAADVEKYRNTGLGSIPDTLVEPVVNPEKAAKGAEFAMRWANEIKNFDFGAEYMPGRKPEQYQATLERDYPRMMEFLGDMQIDTFIDEQKVRYENARKSYGNLRPKDMAQIEKNTILAVKVRQTERLLSEAQAKIEAADKLEKEAKERENKAIRERAVFLRDQFSDARGTELSERAGQVIDQEGNEV